MSILSRLFGKGTSAGSNAGPEPIDYEGYTIFPEPMKDGSRWRIAARIEKGFGEETKVHQLIRADTFEDRESAATESLAKAKIMIDQQGDRIFD